MTDDDTTRVPSTAAAVNEWIKAAVKAVKQAEGWIGKLIVFGLVSISLGVVAVGIAFGLLVGNTDVVIVVLTAVVGLAVFIAGVATACSGLIMSSARRHVQLAKLEQAAQAMAIKALLEDLRAEIRTSRPAEQADLSQLAALIDALAAQVRQVHPALISMALEIGKIRELQGDLESDLAAVVLRQQAASQANGNGSVIRLRPARPDGPG